MNGRITKIIDPDLLNENDLAILGSFLSEKTTPKHVIFHAYDEKNQISYDYDYTDKDGVLCPLTLRLKYNYEYFPSSTAPKEVKHYKKIDPTYSRYAEFSSAAIGRRSTYATAHPVKRIYKFGRENRLVFRNTSVEDSSVKDAFLVKKQSYKASDRNILPKNIVALESTLVKHYPDLHAKGATFASNGHDSGTSFLLLKHLQTETLTEFLRKNSANLSVEQRDQISINFIREIRNLHHRGIKHRDLKPDNIIINRDTLEIKIIDFGLAQKIQTDDGLFGGSPGYAPNETFTQEFSLTQQADYFSAGLILSEIWGASRRKFMKEQAKEFALKSETPKFADLFKGSLNNQLDNSEKAKIKALFIGLTAHFPKDRNIHWERALDFFTQRNLARLKNSAPKKMKAATENAFSLGILTFNAINKIKIEGNSEANKEHKNFPALKEIIFKSLDELKNSPQDILNIFIKALEINAIKPDQNIAAIKETINLTLEKVETNLKTLFLLRDEVEINQQLISAIKDEEVKNAIQHDLRFLLLDIDSLLKKYQKCQCSIDDLVETNNKVNIKLETLDTHLKSFKDKLSSVKDDTFKARKAALLTNLELTIVAKTPELKNLQVVLSKSIQDTILTTPETIQEFTSTLGFKPLLGASSQEELKEKVDNFFVSLNKLHSIKDLLRHFKFLKEKYSITIDPSFTVKLDGLNETLTQIKSGFNSDENFNDKINILATSSDEIFNTNDRKINTILEIAKILVRLEPEIERGNKTTAFKNTIKDSIREYIAATLDTRSIKKYDRAASSERITEMNKIIDALDSAIRPEDITKVAREIKHTEIKTKLPSFLQHSHLRSSINKGLTMFKKNIAKEEKQQKAQTHHKPSI